jgi:hypothetical protein
LRAIPIGGPKLVKVATSCIAFAVSLSAHTAQVIDVSKSDGDATITGRAGATIVVAPAGDAYHYNICPREPDTLVQPCVEPAAGQKGAVGNGLVRAGAATAASTPNAPAATERHTATSPQVGSGRHDPASSPRTSAKAERARRTTPVGEEETYLMMLAGLGLMGFIARRRQRDFDAG